MTACAACVPVDGPAAHGLATVSAAPDSNGPISTEGDER